MVVPKTPAVIRLLMMPNIKKYFYLHRQHPGLILSRYFSDGVPWILETRTGRVIKQTNAAYLERSVGRNHRRIMIVYSKKLLKGHWQLKNLGHPRQLIRRRGKMFAISDETQRGYRKRGVSQTTVEPRPTLVGKDCITEIKMLILGLEESYRAQ